MQRRALALAVSMLLAPPGFAADGDATSHADDAFGSRIGTESIGLYSESLVRGFDLQQAGNYRLDDAYFVRAASPPDTLVEGARIRVGPNALGIGFPAPSGIVQYRLLPADRNRARLELGFQHLLDDNPRPYVRAHFAHQPRDGAVSLAGGAIGSPSARYMFGNDARYHSIGLVPRVQLGDDWQATAFYGHYAQRYEADVGFQAATDRMPRLDRDAYPGQAWSRFDTRNTTYGAILASHPREGRWDYALSAIHSRIERPRSDFNLFTDVTADGWADAAVSVARGRRVHSRAYEASAERDWTRGNHRDRLALVARVRRSSYVSPQVDRLALGRVSLFASLPRQPEPDFAPRTQARNHVEQQEIGAGWQRQWQGGAALNLGVRRVALAESALSASGVRNRRDSTALLYNASGVIPVSSAVTAFASYVRGIEEAGVAPQHATNAFEVLPPAMARQAELGLKWQSHRGATLIGTLFEIAKPEPGFDATGVYRYMSDVRHRGLELSLGADPLPGLRLLFGASWMQARLEGEAVDRGDIGTRPVGRPERLLLAGFEYRPTWAPAFSLDADATYSGPRPADAFDRVRTPGYTLANVGARYRLRIGNTPATLRLRVYNAGDKYAWYADGGGMQAWEPGRRVMLSIALGD